MSSVLSISGYILVLLFLGIESGYTLVRHFQLHAPWTYQTVIHVIIVALCLIGIGIFVKGLCYIRKSRNVHHRY